MKYSKKEIQKNYHFDKDINIKTTGESWGENHYHNLFEIYFITDGCCTYFIDNKSYNLISGDIILIPEGIIHNTLYKDSIHSRTLINCSRRYIPSSVASLVQSKQYLYRNPGIIDEVYKLLAEIEKEYTNPDAYSEDILLYHTRMIFYLLLRNSDSCTDQQPGNEYIENAINYLKENFHTDITLSEVAKKYSVSHEHFSRMFKKETGFGFCEYLNMLRLQKAEQLLKENNKLSIAKIAFTCGFNDSNYFSLKFKQTYGIPPCKMRKR